ncbi:uncharacterized protein FIBRA_01543 [Fibroporia radiculosa]|uniref:Geranylgeranyl pyrophosphate synthetase n=1 Tax=Fibroporia radiculosa TaxID=599839 RepID=J4GKJ6_9APHY|nr:uncharacterized protein FIBRA_01543 [Fibroporia radiculosa]CCL99525.1 predicted protein [Fibroporia radiculosa]
MSYQPLYRRNNSGWHAASSANAPAFSSLPLERPLTEGLASTPFKTFAKPTDPGGKAIAPQNLEYIGSYNWVNATKPTIIVPGSPPEWRNRPLPYRVPRDSGVRFVDQNGYRMPSTTLYPLLRAVDIASASKTIDWGSVDFVTDRNGLRKLLRWINDTDASAKEFRIDTQLAGNFTVLLNRWEKKTREDPDPTRPSYGFSFERESTTKAPGCEQGTGHHRIVKYDFGGLTIVVRFEVDACIAPSRSLRPTAPSANVDSLSDLISGLDVARISQTSKIDTSASTPELDIIRAGSQVLHDCVIELTTRSRNYIHQYDWVDAYPQLYLSQTKHHFLAAHGRGEFTAITKRTLGSPEMNAIDAQLQAGFRKLRRALEEIQELVIEHGKEGRLSLVFSRGKLQVFKRSGQDSCLPEKMLARFDA